MRVADATLDGMCHTIKVSCVDAAHECGLGLDSRADCSTRRHDFSSRVFAAGVSRPETLRYPFFKGGGALGRPSECAIFRHAVALVRRAELRWLLKGTDPSSSRPGTHALRGHHNGLPRLTSRPEQLPQPPPRTTPTPCRETAPTRGDRGRSTGAAPVKDCSEGDWGRRRRGTPTQPPQGTTDPRPPPMTDPPLATSTPRGRTKANPVSKTEAHDQTTDMAEYRSSHCNFSFKL